MQKVLVMFFAALLCYGCGRGTGTGPEEIRSYQQVPGTLIDSFGEEPRTLTSAKVVRVGTYYDFSDYDSLRISFDATRLSTDRPFDEVLVKIGPTMYLRDTVYAIQENVSLGVKVSDIAKPAFCALTFWTLDPQTILKLSRLRVIGWTSSPGH